MSKVLLLNDLHFGLKSDSPVFRIYIKTFLDNLLLPYIKEHDIKTIIFLGDFLDKRKYVNIETLRFSRTEFFEPLMKMGITLHMILGNHDIVFRNTSEVNSTTELYSHYPNVKVYSEPTDVSIEGNTVALIPWLNDNNMSRFHDFVKETKSTLSFGHFAIKGFQVLRGILSEEGIDKEEVGMFHKVFSGHFHQKHDDGQIYYLGTQYDMTFADVDERKGFHTIDLSNGDLEFIENPYKIFYRLVYDDTTSVPVYDYDKYKDCYVKFVVRKKTKPKDLEKIIDRFYQANLAEFNIIEEVDLFVDTTDTVDQTQDTVSIISKEIDSLTDVCADRLKTIINDLYNESYDLSSEDKE